jgi:hypothetical protein
MKVVGITLCGFESIECIFSFIGRYNTTFLTLNQNKGFVRRNETNETGVR